MHFLGALFLFGQDVSVGVPLAVALAVDVGSRLQN